MPSRSQRGPVVRQLENGRAVSGAGRLFRQRVRSTRAHARARTRAYAPSVHTPAHISTALHNQARPLHIFDFGACALTCTCRSGASGRGGLHRARHGGAAPIFRHREPPRALQPPQQEAAKRFAMVLLLVDKSAAGLGSSSCDARHASIMPRRQRMPGRSMRACASAARERAAQQHSEDAMPHEPL